MQDSNIEFSDDQLHFLAVLDAFSGPVSVEIVGVLAPLLPGPLFDLMDKGRSAGWFHRDGENQFSLTGNLPDFLKEKLTDLTCQRALDQMVERVYANQLAEKLGPEQMLSLLKKTERKREAGEYEIRLAHDAFICKDYENTRIYLQAASERLYPICFDPGVGRMFVSSVLEFSNILFSLGYGFSGIEKFLIKANDVTENIGDQRSHALINLHLGRLYYFSNRRDEALVALSMGFEEIHALGDDDILGQSAVFLGLLHFTKGLHKQAIEHFENAEQAFEKAKWGVLTHPTAPFITGYCAIYLGQFHRAIGNLDYQLRLARDRSDMALTATIRATLGTVLTLLRKKKEGLACLTQALEEATTYKSAMGMYFARGGLSLYHYLEGRLEKASKIGIISSKEAAQAGIIHQYASPWVLEMNDEFFRLGYRTPAQFNFPVEMERVLNGANIHLKGVAFRIRAREKSLRGEKADAIENDLDQSVQCLEQSGDSVELSKTILEKARIELRSGNREEAIHLAGKARRLLGGYAEEFFPDEFRHLLENQKSLMDPEHQGRDFLQRYLEMIESLYPVETRQEILTRMLSQTIRMLGAERSALFWFPSGKYTAKPNLRATCNLSRSEIATEAFQTNLAMVRKAFRANQPQVGRSSENYSPAGFSGVLSVLCIPVEVDGAVHGVMYFDNSYLPDAFDFLDPEIMRGIARHTNLVIERRFHHLQVEEERNILVSLKTLDDDRDRSKLIANSKNMTRLLHLSDQVAGTESTVLITGETGTGKELLANRIHKQSQRPQKPFIIVDSTSIPENLVESELFGHEQGAFTGADKRKLGQIEMAHEGTLFFDEIGELPLSSQVKLLRALQEKEFNRVGGTRTIHSDFRLIAATNRDLEEEVAQGRFREDLYYRLNVIPIHLPPLRERQTDIVLLAEHFIRHHARKYNRHNLELTTAQETLLCAYQWPGNVRELQNIIERAVLLSADNQLEFSLPIDIQRQPNNPFEDLPTLEDVQRRYIEFVIKKTGGQIGGVGGAAEILGMNRTSVYSRMRQLKLDINSLRS